jgi:hypothetical protein
MLAPMIATDREPGIRRCSSGYLFGTPAATIDDLILTCDMNASVRVQGRA